MPTFARVIPWLVLAFALLALLLGSYEWAYPPFTDAQIRESRVDTWEVATSTTRVFAIVFLGLGSICVVLARRPAFGAARPMAWLAASACLLAVLLFMRNHVVLWQRVVRLTGEELGPLFGLL